MNAPYLVEIKRNPRFSPTPSRAEREFPLDLPILQNLRLTITRPVLILSGDNGTGKSTLLEAIADHCAFNTNGGNRNHLYHQLPEDETTVLRHALSFAWRPRITDGFFMRAESFVHFADYLDAQAGDFSADVAYGAYGGRSLNTQSHGESFLSLFENRFHRPGLYILDEPEAALSPQRILTFLTLIHQLTKEGDAQFIISTHSPMLMAFPGAQFLYIEDGVLREIDYRDTEHYRLTLSFLQNPERYFRHLFEGE